MLRASIMSVAWVTLVVPASAFDLVVVNESNSSVLQKLYIAPAKTKNWSDDKLQNQAVSKNGHFTIHDVSKGIYDVKENRCGAGHKLISRVVDVCATDLYFNGLHRASLI